MDKKKVGFLGLGNMGFPMAKNLLNAGYSVYGVDVNKEIEKEFEKMGGIVGFTTSSLSVEADIIFTSLPTPQIVENVYLGKEGLVESGNRPLTLVDLSTISPELNRKIAKEASKKGISYLGAPVSGSVSGAEAATLSIMVGGDKEAYDMALPYLEAIGKNIFHVAEDHGLGTVVKLINNLMAGIHTQAVAEALAIADAVGLEHDVVYNIVSVSSGQSDIFRRNFENFIAENEYHKGAFTTALLLKDLKLANHISDSYDVPLPLGEALVNYLNSNIADYANLDMSSVYLMLKEKIKE